MEYLTGLRDEEEFTLNFKKLTIYVRTMTLFVYEIQFVLQQAIK